MRGELPVLVNLQATGLRKARYVAGFRRTLVNLLRRLVGRGLVVSVYPAGYHNADPPVETAVYVVEIGVEKLTGIAFLVVHPLFGRKLDRYQICLDGKTRLRLYHKRLDHELGLKTSREN